MDPYEVLGVSRTAPDSVIKAAFRARIRETHPDAGGDPADAQRVNDAYTTLSNPTLRAQVPPLRAEPQQEGPTEPPARTRAPSPASPATVAEDPYLVFSHDRDHRPLWKRRGAWIPVAIAMVVGAGTGGPLGAAAALAASAVLLLRWSPKVIVGAFLVAAVPTLFTLAAATSAPTIGELIPGLVAVAALIPVLLVWAVINRRLSRADDERAADIFVTTRERFGLDEVVVLDLLTGTAGHNLARLQSVDGRNVGTYALAPSSFPVNVGNRVLLHDQQPFYAVPAGILH